MRQQANREAVFLVRDEWFQHHPELHVFFFEFMPALRRAIGLKPLIP
jgi:membrane protein DedA with SNARE-associated domain